MEDLKKIPIVRQRHPDISPLAPFDVVWEYRAQPMKKFEADMHYALQFCIILRGGMEMAFEGFQREYQAGEMWWTMFWEPHAFRFSRRRNFAVMINIDLDHLGNCDPFGECNWLLPFVLTPAARYHPASPEMLAEARSAGRKLFKLWVKREPYWKLESWLLIHQLILRAVKNITQNQQDGTLLEFADGFKRIQKAIALVKGSVGRPPALADAASACGLSPSRFSEVFRKSAGVSFGKFAARARLFFAANDLKRGALAIEEVAEKWAFFDNSHFCHAFKELYGCTPVQYRRQSLR